MNRENYNTNPDSKQIGSTSLPEKMDDIIELIKNNSTVTDALVHDKKLYNDFTLLLSDLNELISEKKEISQKFEQISMFLS